MAFVVEDATGLTDATAYISVAEFKAYHDDRGNDYATAFDTDPKIQFAIIKATDYIEQRWGSVFKGCREFPDNPQALSFPRADLYDREGNLVEGIPNKLKYATAEYAIRTTSDLFPDPVVHESGRAVTRELKKVGPIEKSTSFVSGSDVRTVKPYPAADRLLSEYVSGGSRVIRD